MTEETNPPRTGSRRPADILAIVGFIVSLMSFSIGLLNLPWGVGIVGALIGLVLSVWALCRRSRRLWAVAGIILSVLFLLLTLLLSIALGLPLSTMMRL
ncbi:MAG: hypothetical protein K2I64_01115 [Muribaculaceae bacterium]|nr:hypothetical protein [Muribaculaceae bacterium]